MARQQPETKIVKQILAALQNRGWLAWKVHTSQYGAIGISDIQAVKDGRFASIEVKQPGKHPTALQSRWIDEIKRYGGMSGVATSVSEALQIVGEYQADGNDDRTSSEAKRAVKRAVKPAKDRSTQATPKRNDSSDV